MNKQKGISTTLSILLVVLLIVVVGGAVVYKYYLAPEGQPSTGEPSTTTQPGGEDTTANWKTYRNNVFKYEIRYPDKVFTKVPESDSDNKNTVFSITPQTAIIIQIGQNPEKLSITDWVEQSSDDVAWEVRKYKDFMEEVVINGKKCIKVVSATTSQGLPMDQWVHVVMPFSEKVVIISKVEKEKGYGLEQIYNQILPTFHFLEGTVVDELPIPNAPTLSYLEGASPFVQINWNWEIADYFNIYRASSLEGPWEKIIGLFPKSAHTAVDYHLPEGVDTLYYKIASVDKEGNESGYSEVSSVNIK